MRLSGLAQQNTVFFLYTYFIIKISLIFFMLWSSGTQGHPERCWNQYIKINRGHQGYGGGSSSELSFPQRSVATQTETVKINVVRTLGNSQTFTTMKQILNQEKSILKIIGKLCAIFTCPYCTPLPSNSPKVKAVLN